MAIRAALGSGRRRLVRTMFTESLLLEAMLGTGAGIALAEALPLQWFVRAHPVEIPPSNALNLNWQVLLFHGGAGCRSSIFFGLFPAFRGSRRSEHDPQ